MHPMHLHLMGDGYNDYWIPIGKGVVCDEFELMVFNRCGELIFESDCTDKYWDGMHKGQTVRTDVYVWKAKFKDINGECHFYYGHINLLR
jgi:gliding motility-associated-like protein